MTFTIHYPPQDEEDAAPRRKNSKVEQKVTNILEAKDLAHEEYDEISKLKKMGIFVKDGTKVKVNPIILLNFEKDLVLQITLAHG
jgi:hypothetical protein